MAVSLVRCLIVAIFLRAQRLSAILIRSVDCLDPPYWSETRSITRKSKEGDGGSQVLGSYHTLVPTNYQDDPQVKWPVVLMIHGAGSDAKSLAQSGDMADVGPRRGYVLAYLEGQPTPRSQVCSKERMWNSGTCGADKGQDRDDVEFVRSVVKDLVEHVRVDPGRVFVAGQSHGGSMVWRITCEAPELFAGAAMLHGSLEFRIAEPCRANCSTDANTGCVWDSRRAKCTSDTWVSALPSVYDCGKMQGHPLSVLLIDGLENSWYSAGMFPGCSWPSVNYTRSYTSDLLGCVEPYSTLATSTSQCTSFKQCGSSKNVTMCDVKGGDWWYGKEYDVVRPCKRRQTDHCSREDLIRQWGHFSEDFDVTAEVLAFFSKAV